MSENIDGGFRVNENVVVRNGKPRYEPVSQAKQDSAAEDKLIALVVLALIATVAIVSGMTFLLRLLANAIS